MPLSPELQRIYSSAPLDEIYFETMSLHHSRFTQDFYLIKDVNTRTLKLGQTGAASAEFVPYPFNVVLSSIGEGQTEMRVAFDNVTGLPTEQLDLASEAIHEPVRAVYRVYREHSDVPQSEPINLVLTNVTADRYTLTAVATRPDLYAKHFPGGPESTYDARFKGLWL